MKGLSARRPSPAMVVAVIALVCALTGTAWALGKNSVGTKQLKNGAVATAKLKKEAVTAAKVKKSSLTGKDIDLAKLGTVPSAASAINATNAVNATNAGTASALTPPEAVRYVGTPGEPQFIDGSNVLDSQLEEAGTTGISARKVGFYRDHEGIVHLEGEADVGDASPYPIVFTLPPGFRPASKTFITFPSIEGDQVISIDGSGVTAEGHDYGGSVVLYGGGSDNLVSLNGITFRAES